MSVILNACQSIQDVGTVTISTQPAENAILIKIADTGEGIPEALLSKIFDPGYTTRGVGTGLGLSIVHKIIEKHAGSIDVSSTVGTGTKVLISLPTQP
jgi:signal transduction histidine kinase